MLITRRSRSQNTNWDWQIALVKYVFQHCLVKVLAPNSGWNSALKANFEGCWTNSPTVPFQCQSRIHKPLGYSIGEYHLSSKSSFFGGPGNPWISQPGSIHRHKLALPLASPFSGLKHSTLHKAAEESFLPQHCQSETWHKLPLFFPSVLLGWWLCRSFQKSKAASVICASY